MSTITNIVVPTSQTWGVNFYDYAFGGTATDFETLMVAVSLKRATAVEGEVSPLATRMRMRNTEIDELGSALADLTKVQACFASDAKGTDRSGTSIQDSTYQTLKKVFGDANGNINFSNYDMTKYEVEEWLQRVESKIDSLNNSSETDMSRLESLVDRRDESYSTASDLMSEVSDTRSNLIGNL